MTEEFAATPRAHSGRGANVLAELWTDLGRSGRLAWWGALRERELAAVAGLPGRRGSCDVKHVSFHLMYDRLPLRE